MDGWMRNDEQFFVVLWDSFGSCRPPRFCFGLVCPGNGFVDGRGAMDFFALVFSPFLPWANQGATACVGFFFDGVFLYGYWNKHGRRRGGGCVGLFFFAWWPCPARVGRARGVGRVRGDIARALGGWSCVEALAECVCGIFGVLWDLCFFVWIDETQDTSGRAADGSAWGSSARGAGGLETVFTF